MNDMLRSMFNDLNTMNNPTLRVEVNFDGSQMVAALSEILLREMHRIAGVAGGDLLSEVVVDDIRRYLLTTSWMRCAHVIGLSDKIYAPYRRLIRYIAIPVVWYQVLIGIGRALDRDYSIEFYPGASIRETDLLAPEEMLYLSDLMFSLQNNGLKVVAGIPLSEEGELDFMAMAHVEETVLSYRRTHPVYGFLASFFATREVSEMLGVLVRIRYGCDSDYRTMLARVVTSLGGGGD